MQNPRKRFALQFSLNFCLALALLLLARPAQAAVGGDRYVSVNGHDTGTCSTMPDACLTIDYAVNQANSGDTIHLSTGTFSHVSLGVAKSLTFSGTGVDHTTLDGGGTDTTFKMVANFNVAIENLTIMNGNAGASGCGGGISQSTGTLALWNVKVTNNTANCGAGISSHGSLTIMDSEISNNHATAASNSSAGGLELAGAGNTFTLIRVTIRGNTANGNNGGITIKDANTSTLTNVTISENTGSINSAMNIYNSAQVTIINSTIANNHRTQEGYTGGIASQSTVIIKNSIVAGNEGSNCSIMIGSTWTSQGNNIDSGDSCQFSSEALNDHRNTDPRLGSLADHGGLVQTMALQRGSPAIDGITYNSPNGCPVYDARGISRPFGTYCDIGAYEFNMANFIFLPLLVK